MVSRGASKDLASAATAFSVLGDSFRLEVFRAVAKAGASGVLSSDLTRDLGAAPARAAAALRVLRRAGVVESRRDGRYARYAVGPQFRDAVDLVRPPGT